jgi:hypothetical protein
MIYVSKISKSSSLRLPEYSSYLTLVNRKPIMPITAKGGIDAIIVPAGRQSVAIAGVAQLAHKMKTPLVVLCSKDALGKDIAQVLAAYKRLVWYAIDIPEDYSHPLIALTAGSFIPVSGLMPSDVGKKRNIGLIVGKGLGDHILFLDDDVTLQSTGLRAAARMLVQYPIVGFSPHPDSFPDNSVAVHAIRALRRFQLDKRRTIGQHLNGGSLAVNLQTSTSHFPEKVCDEDWLFMYEATARRQVAQLDETFSQAVYDPFASPKRAVQEEFGNIISKGLYDSLKVSAATRLTDERYWKEILKARKQKLEALIEIAQLYKADVGQPEKIHNIVNSLAAALKVNRSISSGQCVAYYRAWHEVDTPNWNKRYAELPASMGVMPMLELLGLLPYTKSSHTHAHDFRNTPE